MADPGPLTGPIKRLNYFKYQFLNASDFIDEQNYHRRMLWTHNQALHSQGVGSGFEVRPGSSAGTLVITSGVAVDGYGRELILGEDRTWNIPGDAPSPFFLTVHYDEQPTDLTSTPDVTNAPTRTEEDPEFAVFQTQPSGPADVLLAQITLDASRNATVDEAGANRQRSTSIEGDLTIRPPDPRNPQQWVKLFWSGANQADLAGGLRLVAPPGTSASNLSVAGTVAATGLLTAGGGANVTGPLAVAGNETVGGALAVAGAVALAGTLGVTGLATLSGGVTVPGGVGLTVAGPTRLTGAVTAPGGATIGTGLTVGGPGSVSGNLSVGGTLGVTGATTVTAVTAAGPVGIGTGAGGVAAGNLLDIRGQLGITSANAPGIVFADATGAVYPTNWIGMANNIDGTKRFLHVGGITDTGGDNLRRIALYGDRVFVSGNLGLGVTNPADRLSVAGNVRLTGDYQLTTGRSMLLMGRTDGSTSSADELLGAVAFLGGGVQHGQLSFRAGRGFELVDRSGDGPGLNYTFDSHAYANLKVAGLTLTGNLTLPAAGQINAPGRLHISGDETLYLLNKNGVIIGKEWSGTGTLTVEGALSVGEFIQAGPASVSSVGSYSVFGHNVHWAGTTGWAWQDNTRPAWMIYAVSSAGSGSFNVYTTTASALTSFTARLTIDSNTGVTYLYGDLHVQGNLFASNKAGFVSDQFVNALDETLEAGDVVVVGQNQISLFYGENDAIPIPEVDLTESAYDRRVYGVVAEVHPQPNPPEVPQPGEEPDTLPVVIPQPKDTTKVSPGQIGLVVTLGAFSRCKVDADIAPIEPGDLLTTSPTRGHAQKVVDVDKARGAILGKALGSLEKGKGTIPVLVTLH